MKHSSPTRLATGLAAALFAAACSENGTTTPVPTLTPMQNGIASVSLQSEPGSLQSIAPGRVIVRYKEGADHASVESANGVMHLESLGLPRGEIVSVPVGSEAERAAALNADPSVEFAQVDRVFVVQPCDVGNCEQPTDGFFPRKWDLHNDGTVRSSLAVPTLLALTARVDADIDWLEMFDFVGPTFAGEARVGIIDSGIRETHQDVAGKVIANANFAFLYPPTLIQDRAGHGSHVAGIAAARGNNGLGVSGVGYGANIKLINAKACELYNVGGGVIQTLCFESSVANAITYAVDQGANVINLSLGGSAPSALQQAALQYALARNTLPVCATGNNNAATISFPARFPECFAVGASDWGDTRTSYSNFGPEIDVVAPGGDTENQPHSLILSLSISSDATYAFNAGTSMATPQVAGLAAMLYATGVATTPAAMADRIRNTADDLGPAGFDNETGFGRINAYRAISGLDPAAPPVANIGGPYDPSPEGSAVAFDGSASSDPNGKPITYAWNFGDGSTSTSASPSHTYADNGSYSVTLTVTDQSGRSATSGTTVAVTNALPAVQVSLSAASILSGASVDLTGGFSDAGVADAPWSWSIAWGNGSTGGTTSDMAAAIAGSRTYCVAGTFAVQLSVTDKDGGTGVASAPLVVSRNSISIELPAVFNAASSGRLPVRILSTSSFDATTLDLLSITLGGAPVALKGNGEPQATPEDVNGDGLLDLVVHFDRQAIDAGTGEMALLATGGDGCVQYRGVATARVR